MEGIEKMGSDLVKIDQLSFSYHTLNGETRALENLSFSVKEGEFLAIVGPSGCGNAMVQKGPLCLQLPFLFIRQCNENGPVLVKRRVL